MFKTTSTLNEKQENADEWSRIRNCRKNTNTKRKKCRMASFFIRMVLNVSFSSFFCFLLLSFACLSTLTMRAFWWWTFGKLSLRWCCNHQSAHWTRFHTLFGLLDPNYCPFTHCFHTIQRQIYVYVLTCINKMDKMN